jgi:7,8-dihydropterin-6-yl-methyl-4-(beta-D-ribofuranosyl)aminobenzene 5'-phosphate synthase
MPAEAAVDLERRRGVEEASQGRLPKRREQMAVSGLPIERPGVEAGDPGPAPGGPLDDQAATGRFGPDGPFWSIVIKWGSRDPKSDQMTKCDIRHPGPVLRIVMACLILAIIAMGRSAAPDRTARLTVLYDNTAAREGAAPDWGFSCLIEGMGKTVLFDTGTDPKILQANIRTLGIDAGRIEAVVISHLHSDHTGGLLSICEKRPSVTVYVPATLAPAAFSAVPAIDKMARQGTKIVRVSDPVSLCPGVRLTGQVIGPNGIPEVSLLLETKGGGTLITGCAHPGIVDIVRKAAAGRGKPIEAVIGGFHLSQTPEADTVRIISDMKAAGVVRCGATHCTGEPAIARFRDAFGKDFIPLGVGRVIDF